MRPVYLFILLLSLSAYGHNQIQRGEDKLLVSFKLTDSVKQYLRTHDLDVTGVNHDEGTIDALLTQEEVDVVSKLKTSFIMKLPQKLLKGPDPEYQNPTTVEARLREFNSRYSDITQLRQIGTSLEGRAIWGLKISDNPLIHELAEPAILFNGMHHAREVMTPEINLDIIEYLLTNYSSDNRVRGWVESNEIWVIPMFNVDGNNRMWSRDSMWRKNARDNYGVDLNRNYPTGWNSCNGSSGTRSSQTYRGVTAASEPETQVMMNFVSEIRPVFNISYHSYSELVLYPYGCNPQRVANRDVVEGIGREIGTRLGYRAGTPWELLYNADGGDIDWMYQERQVIPYVIEVSSSREGFQPDYNRWRDVTVQKNRAGWQYLLERMNGPAVSGFIAQAQETTIDVFNAQGTKIQTYKVNPDGSYHIVLMSGDYTLEFRTLGRSSMRKQIKIGNQRLELERM